jgi:hypothetical protein
LRERDLIIDQVGAALPGIAGLADDRVTGYGAYGLRVAQCPYLVREAGGLLLGSAMDVSMTRLKLQVEAE